VRALRSDVVKFRHLNLNFKYFGINYGPMNVIYWNTPNYLSIRFWRYDLFIGRRPLAIIVRYYPDDLSYRQWNLIK
jgi:hypothetical protein